MENRECLIVDDDLDEQEIFLMCIKKISEDINCNTASSGIEAVALLTNNPKYCPDYIFIDVNMPKMNGVDCLKILKSIERLKCTKVFMYSTTSEKNTVLKSTELGADDYIVKPSSTIALKEKLAKIFEMAPGINK